MFREGRSLKQAEVSQNVLHIHGKAHNCQS